MILVSLFIANTRGEVPDKTDYWGIFLSSLSLGLLLFGFELASHDGMLNLALCLLARVGSGHFLRPSCPAHAGSHSRYLADEDPNYGTSVIAGAITRVSKGRIPICCP